MSTPTRQGRVRSRAASAVALLFLLSALLPQAATAQSAQMFSLQFSGLVAYPFGGGLEDVDVGVGWEAQLRVNPSAFSIGAGVEQTFHSVVGADDRDVVLLGGFLEPRYVLDIGMDNAVAYLSGRAALSQITLTIGQGEDTGTGYTLNGGGGLLFRLSDRVNLDAGATVGYKTLGEVDVAGTTYDLGTGANVVGRLGLAIGL